MMFSSPYKRLAVLLLCLGYTTGCIGAEGERWFQIEVSIFSNEDMSARDSEVWIPDYVPGNYPDSLRVLDHPLDLLLLESHIILPSTEPVPESDLVQTDSGGDNLDIQQQLDQLRIQQTGPFPAINTEPADFNFFDFSRQPFLHLPQGESDFRQTNRAIERSAEHRLLYHALWRQPLKQLDEAMPVLVQGGQRYGVLSELGGTLRFGFNEGQTRVVIDADLWFAEFSGNQNEGWQLPEPPAETRTGLRQRLLQSRAGEAAAGINRIFTMKQSRDMRSNEFHYLDNPALGLVVFVIPYEVPPLEGGETENGFSIAEEL